MWGSFYANLQPGLLAAHLDARMRFLSGCVRPIGRFKWSRWPYQGSYAKRLDGIQVAMISRLVLCPPDAQEAPLAYFGRRARYCGRLADASGRWSMQWRRQTIEWDAHIRRAHDPLVLSHTIIDWKSEAYLLSLRANFPSGGSLSRTITRTGPGRPATRWFEGHAIREIVGEIGSGKFSV